ncbi:GyrI-like domain-containing protein [Isoptericola sediminis]|uniref:GyrI-like domain-containing protein n=1 Tax=Isoptericola sediminis TaxID=2733572 RepID=A0A849JXM0_9MICO|nr:GyrI-like domain-containing protein [Isoptericola sediminis]NNU28056.1 GyrI-like domain-containing protein [Isoptericola sediminis]
MSAPSFTDPTIETRGEQHLAVVRETVALADIPALYDRALPLIFAALGRAGVEPVGPPLGISHRMPAETLDLSVAVPVAEPFADDGEVAGETLPAGRAATVLVRGEYDQIAPAYEHLFGWVAAQGLVPTGIAWEQYLTEPSPGGDPSRTETLVGVDLVG